MGQPCGSKFGLQMEKIVLLQDIGAKFKPELVFAIQTITLSNCELLTVNLTLQSSLVTSIPKFDLQIKEVNVLKLIAAHGSQVLNRLTLDNVTSMETRFNDNDDTLDGYSTEEIYFYIIIGLSALLLVTVVCLISVLICNCCGSNQGSKRQSNSSCCKTKRRRNVSRAESWRFESSMYVKPPNQRHQQPVQVKRDHHKSGEFNMTHQAPSTRFMVSVVKRVFFRALTLAL